MVGYSVQRILLVSALVGCALFGTAASDKTPSLDQIGQYFQLFKPSAAEPPEEADEPLLTRLQRRSLQLDRLKNILINYGDKEERIMDRTVEELVEMCEPTLEKCSYDEFERVIMIGDEFRETIPKLYEYSQYCLHAKLRGFCRHNSDLVIQDLEAKVTEEERIWVVKFLNYLEVKAIASDEHIVWAYFFYKNNDFPDEDEFEFLNTIRNALYLHYIQVLGKKEESPLAKLINFVSSSSHEDEMSITPWDTLDMIFERFIRLRSSKIKETLYDRASRALTRQFYGRSLDFDEVEEIFLEYKHKDVKILGDTVAELLEMCQESVTKCNYDDFERILLFRQPYEDDYPPLFEYRRHCAVKLKGHCLDHIDEVAPDLAKGVDDDYKALVQRFLESVQEAGPIDKATTNQLVSNIFQAYNLVKESKCGEGDISLSEEKEFLAKLKRALFVRYLEVPDESRAAPDDGSLGTKQDDLSIIFENFIEALDSHIEPSMYGRAKEALISQLEEEDNRLTNENVREMLQEYEDKDAKICDKTVGEWVEMCKPSMSNCSYDAFSKMIKRSKKCREDYPKIFQYRTYCVEKIVGGYCRENADKVSELVLGRISEGAKLFVFLLVKITDDCVSREFGEHAAPLCRILALDKVMEFTFKKKVKHQKLFKQVGLDWLPKTICDFVKPFAELNYLFSAGLKYKQGQVGAPQGDFWRLSVEAEEFWNYLKCSEFY